MKVIVDDLYKNRPLRIYRDVAPTLRSERQGLKVIECKEYGSLRGGKWDKMHEISRRVYCSDGISPTIHTCGVGNTEIKVALMNVETTIQQLPRGKNKGGEHPICPTITTCAFEQNNFVKEPTAPFVVASRGRNPDNPSDRTKGIKTEQRLEPNQEGLCNTLTSVQRDNYLAEPCTENIRIRKLTPKECWRLMGFSDEDFARAEAVNSNTQLYKQAGNSIVTNVLAAIFWELLGGVNDDSTRD